MAQRKKLIIVILIVIVALELAAMETSIVDARSKLVREEQPSLVNAPAYREGAVILQTKAEPNAIESVKVTCFLHLKTAQILMDINYVGTASTPTISPLGTINESVLIKGAIRNVRVIEEGTTELTYEKTIVGNDTTITFEFSSTIPLGVKRNVKISFLQDTKDYESHYNYQLGMNWNRTIGSQNVIFICDAEISLLEADPEPHTISSVGGQLTLSWLQVNPMTFQTSLNYTRKLTLQNLLISPSKWDIGKIRSRNNPLEKVFAIFNNESTELTGIIVAPNWLVVNTTNWSLGIGETMHLKVSIDLTRIGRLEGNISLQCSNTYLPVNIQVTGEVREGIPLEIVLPMTVIPTISALAVVGVVLLRRKKPTSNGELVVEEKPIVEQGRTTPSKQSPRESIDLSKWKELLTEKEYAILEVIVEQDEMTQTDLCRLTNLSKSTVSRAVGRLEAKGLIRKEKYGISNFVVLNEDFFR